MFAKSNKFLYYGAIAFCLYAFMQLYFERKSRIVEVKKEVVKEEEVVDFKGLFSQISDAIKSPATALSGTVQDVPTPNFKTTFFSLQNGEGRVGLCSNTYALNVKLFNEDGDEIYAKRGLKMSEVKGELYDELNRSLTLTSAGDKFEIFAKNLGIIPAFMVKNPDDASKSGILKVEVANVIGTVNFSAKGVKTFNTIYPDNTGKSRAKSRFFCKEKVRVSYGIYDTSGGLVKEEVVSLTLGKTLDKTAFKKEQILEYLVLNSKDGNLDAIVPSKAFSENSKEQSFIVKGKIFKGDEQ